MHLQLITPEKMLYDGEALMVLAPGTEGEFGVLPGHAPLISTLKAGEIVIDLPDKTQKRIAIQNGVAEVTPERVMLLVELASEPVAA